MAVRPRLLAPLVAVLLALLAGVAAVADAAPATRFARMNLSEGPRAGQGFLAPPGIAVSRGTTTIYRTSGALLPPALSNVPTSTAFTSPRLQAAVQVSGVPRVQLKLAHTATGAIVVYPRLYDVAPDGTARRLDSGDVVARIPASRESANGPTYVSVALSRVRATVRAGHALRLVVASIPLGGGTAVSTSGPDQITLTYGPRATSDANAYLKAQNLPPSTPAVLLPVDDPARLSPGYRP